MASARGPPRQLETMGRLTVPLVAERGADRTRAGVHREEDRRHLAEHGVRVTSSLYGVATRLRWVAHLYVNEADVTAALDCVKRFQLPG